MSHAPGRQRADVLAVTRGLVPSRARAAQEIRAGTLYADGRLVTKPSEMLAETAALELRGAAVPYVSRAWLKLAHGLDHFGLDPSGTVALDIGASTGGFTEVLLKRGAARVYAVDVGHGQLHRGLAQDPRVVSIEGLNARELSRAQVPDPIDFIVCDVSFIGLRLVLPPTLALAAPGARLVALIKPQFEAGPQRVGKGGVVRDPAIHDMVCGEIRDWLAAQTGWTVLGLTRSPIEGGDGNTEFLIAGQKA